MKLVVPKKSELGTFRVVVRTDEGKSRTMTIKSDQTLDSVADWVQKTLTGSIDPKTKTTN